MQNTTAETPFMTIRAAARFTGLSENFLRTMQKNGQLPGISCGVSFKVNVPVLLAQLDNESARGLTSE